MLFRQTAVATIAITQPSHAWLSGQIMRQWGNATFGHVTPYEDVCLGAEQHDIGWLAWEQKPTLNVATGRPHSFREVNVAAHTGIWRQGTKLAMSLGRYPALLVLLHGTGLYANFASANEDDTAIVRGFLASQTEIQHRLIESLKSDTGYNQYSDANTIERNRGLVRAADRISIALCAGMRDMAIRSGNPREGIVADVPTSDGLTDIVLRGLDDDLTEISVTPWPFSGTRVRLACEGTILPPHRFETQHEMRAALENGTKVALSMELRPG
jgi:hypothetical protein